MQFSVLGLITMNPDGQPLCLSVDRPFERTVRKTSGPFLVCLLVCGPTFPVKTWSKRSGITFIDQLVTWPTWQDSGSDGGSSGLSCWGSTPSLQSETSFTYHDAEYVFVGVADVSLTLDADSALFATAICGGCFERTQCSFG